MVDCVVCRYEAEGTASFLMESANIAYTNHKDKLKELKKFKELKELEKKEKNFANLKDGKDGDLELKCPVCYHNYQEVVAQNL